MPHVLCQAYKTVHPDAYLAVAAQLHNVQLVMQEIMAREQELLLDEFTKFVGVLDGRNDLTIQQAKSWTMSELMDDIHPVSSAIHPALIAST